MKRPFTVLVLALAATVLGAAQDTTEPSYKSLKFPTLRQIQLPNIESYKLPNGMRIYLLENHELPLVSGFALVSTGNLFDPPGKIGLADITGTVMRTGGTRSKTGDDLDIELENIAASVESSIGENSGQVSFSCLKENTDEVMGAFRDVLTEPEFRQNRIDLITSQLRSAISRRNDNAGGILNREFSDIIYGKDTPYGWRMEYATIDRIQRDDLVSFYKRYYFPGNIMLAVYGDFSTAEMKTRLDKLFGGWNYQQPVVPPFPDVERKPRPGTYLADKADVEQTFFAVGHLGGILKDKNEPALAIMADILGGGFSSRLFRRVRTQLGYAYNVSAGWGAGYTQPGIFEISGSTKALSTTAALQVVREETERIRTSEVSDQELGTAKDTVLNSFVFNFDTPSKTLSRLIRYEYYGYPKDFIFQYQKAVQAVTKADVLRVAKEYLHPEEFTLVAVGNPKNFGKPLSALGMPVQAIDLTIPQPKAEVAKSDPVSMEKGKALLQRAQAALGGADRLAAVKDTTGTSEVTVQSPDGPMKITQTNRWIAPSYFRQDVTLPFGKMSTYYDGKSGWISSPQGSGPMPPPVLKQAGSEMWRNFFVLILSDRDPARKVNYAGDGVVQISDGEGNAVSLQIDEKTGLPVKETFTSAGPGGAPSQVEERFEDWTEAGGVKVPKKVTVNRGGSKFADSNNVDLKINTGLKVEDISRKP